MAAVVQRAAALPVSAQAAEIGAGHAAPQLARAPAAQPQSAPSDLQQAVREGAAAVAQRPPLSRTPSVRDSCAAEPIGHHSSATVV